MSPKKVVSDVMDVAHIAVFGVAGLICGTGLWGVASRQGLLPVVEI